MEIKNLAENPIIKIHKNLEINREKIHPKDYVFFNVEMIKKAAQHSIKFKDCEQCKDNLKDLEALSEEFPQLLKTISGRKNFSRRLDKVLAHLRKEHKIYPAGYFRAIYSLIGILTGIGLSLLAEKLHLLSFYSAIVTIGALALIIGYFYGGYIDQKIKKQGLQL